MCADCPTSCRKKDPVLNPGGMESRTKPLGGEGICQRGCGLLLSGRDIGKGEHCCVDALRTVTDALEERRAALEHEARMSRLRWNRREQFLLAQVSTLQNEAQLAALKYQQRLHQHMLHINSIAQQVTGFCKSDLGRTADMQSQTSDKATCAEGETREQVRAPEMCCQQKMRFLTSSDMCRDS